jgi:hypothetical protein
VPIDYEKISRDNVIDYGKKFDDIGQLISEKLYSDRTHFIYELLQNAEDALGRRDPGCAAPSGVSFRLFADRLEFSHFGKPFDEQDVLGICTVLQGTKKNDQSQIGKFGIGFKSVYSFTASPEIHSGDEHFRIAHYIHPQAISPPDRALRPGETLFIFPFNHARFTAAEATKAITERLAGLGLRTLLFLRHTADIVWEAGPVRGTYLREIDTRLAGYSTVTMMGESTGKPSEEEKWLVFQKGVTFATSGGTARVEVAFSLDKKGEAVVPTANLCLSAYFPTEKQLPMGFLIQGPYNTTLVDEWNRWLIEETANLVVQSLETLRDAGMLTAATLEAMPIRPEKFTALPLPRSVGAKWIPEDRFVFWPFFERVRAALLEKSLLPTHGNTHTSARNAKLARGTDLRGLLSNRHLQQLFRTTDELRWLSGDITSEKTSELRQYLLWALGVPEIDSEDFAKQFSEDFVRHQTDEWIVRLYAFLKGQQALWKNQYAWQPSSPPLASKPIIRLEDGNHVPFSSPVYLPPRYETDFPCVKRTIAKEPQALEFLKALGLREPDIGAEVIEKILPKYSATGSLALDDAAWHADLGRIMEARKTLPQALWVDLAQKLKDTTFVRATEPATDGAYRCKPAEVYVRAADIAGYFDGAEKIYLLHPFYSSDETKFLCELGTPAEVRIRSGVADLLGHVSIRAWWGDHSRGREGFDPGASVDGLENALGRPTLDKCRFIWNRLLVPNAHLIRGVVEKCSRQQFDSGVSSVEKVSPIGEAATNSAWLPDRNGCFHKPCELFLEDLPEEFARDEALARQLGMKTSLEAALARERGIDPKRLQRLLELDKSNPKGVDHLLEMAEKDAHLEQPDPPSYVVALQLQFNHPQMHDEEQWLPESGPVGNPALRRERTQAEIDQDRAIEPDKEDRFKRVPSRIWEAKNNTVRAFLEDQYQGRCQICGLTFPKRDGRPYFEGVYVVSHVHARWSDREGNVLCLCPTCCAKFLHGSVETEDILSQIESFRMLNEGGKPDPALSIILCGKCERIHFSERHMHDLQEIVRAESRNAEA